MILIADVYMALYMTLIVCEKVWAVPKLAATVCSGSEVPSDLTGTGIPFVGGKRSDEQNTGPCTITPGPCKSWIGLQA